MRATPQSGLGSSGAATEGFDLLIGGQWLAAEQVATFAAHDPYLEQDRGQIAEASPADVGRAVGAPRRAFADGRWSGLLAAERARIMLRLADLIERDAELICPLLSGPKSLLFWTTKEFGNGQEGQAGGDHRQAA